MTSGCSTRGSLSEETSASIRAYLLQAIYNMNNNLKVSTRTGVLLVVWVLMTAVMALLTNDINWTWSPLNFISFIGLIVLIISVLLDNVPRH